MWNRVGDGLDVEEVCLAKVGTRVSAHLGFMSLTLEIAAKSLGADRRLVPRKLFYVPHKAFLENEAIFSLLGIFQSLLS